MKNVFEVKFGIFNKHRVRLERRENYYLIMHENELSEKIIGSAIEVHWIRSRSFRKRWDTSGCK